MPTHHLIALSQTRWPVDGTPPFGRSASVRVERLFLDGDFPRRIPGTSRAWGLLDTGAPLCVFPYELASSIRWQRLGSALYDARTGQQAALTWNGLPADFGTADFWLTDTVSDRLRSYTLAGKFVRVPTPAHIALGPRPWFLLGLNFLRDHAATLHLPAPHLTQARLELP